jgi:hypothetical protein
MYSCPTRLMNGEASWTPNPWKIINVINLLFFNSYIYLFFFQRQGAKKQLFLRNVKQAVFKIINIVLSLLWPKVYWILFRKRFIFHIFFIFFKRHKIKQHISLNIDDILYKLHLWTMRNSCTIFVFSLQNCKSIFDFFLNFKLIFDVLEFLFYIDVKNKF